MKVKSLSHVRLVATQWTAAHQAPPSMGFSRQEDWSGVPLPSPVQNEELTNKDLMELEAQRKDEERQEEEEISEELKRFMTHEMAKGFL